MTTQYPSSIIFYSFSSTLYLKMYLRYFPPLFDSHLLTFHLRESFLTFYIHFCKSVPIIFFKTCHRVSFSEHTTCGCCCVLTLSLSLFSVCLWCPLVLAAFAVESLFAPLWVSFWVKCWGPLWNNHKSTPLECSGFMLQLVTSPAALSFTDLSVMEVNAIPSFSSKDEEINFWKSLSIKYKNR